METTFNGDDTLTTVHGGKQSSFESGGEAPADPMQLEPMQPLLPARLAAAQPYFKGESCW
jgi:hypothetical protein